MRVVTISRTGGPGVLEIRNVPDPHPGPGEVSIKVSAAGINFADILARKGLYPDAPRPPAVAGYEIAGEVLEVSEYASSKTAPGVMDATEPSKRFAPGDRVLALTRFNGYSETVVVPQHQVFPVPENLSPAEAAAIPVNYLTAWQLAEMGCLKGGDTLLIHNAGGGVGLAALDLARRRGARTIGTASAWKHEPLIGRGLDVAIDYRTEDWVGQVLEHTGGRGVDLIFDPVGGSNWKKSFKTLRPTGRLGMFGVSEVTQSPLPGPLKFLSVLRRIPFYTPLQLMNQNKGVYGVNIGRLWQEKQKVMQWALAILEGAKEGWIRPQVDAVFSFEQAAEAHRYIEERRNFGKVLLTPGKLSDSRNLQAGTFESCNHQLPGW